ncbi:unnamed protein product [Closterium sp. NIES-53]
MPVNASSCELPCTALHRTAPITTLRHAIKDMVVRGAPAIAIAAALALAVEVHQHSVFESADAAVKHITDRLDYLVSSGGAPAQDAAVKHITNRLDYLVSSRPTAVNLSDAAEKLKRVAEEAAKEEPTPEAVVLVSRGSAGELSDDVAGNKRIGAFGAQAVVEALRQKGVEGKNLRVLTHCNTGSAGVMTSLHVQGLLETMVDAPIQPGLAPHISFPSHPHFLATAAHDTALGVIRFLHALGSHLTCISRSHSHAFPHHSHSLATAVCSLPTAQHWEWIVPFMRWKQLLATAAYGTALGVIRSLHAQCLLETAVCTETRPYNQGSRLTAFELTHDGIPALLIADSAAASLKAAGRIDAVVVGADRIAANGDTANKIGTYSLALSAFHHKTPFFVAAPLTSIDAAIKTGEEIVVEERHSAELTHSLGGAGPQGVIWKKEGASVFDIRGFLHSLGAPVPSSPMYPRPANNPHTKEDDAQPHTDPHKDRIRKDALEASRFTPVSEHTVPAFLQDHPDLAARLGGGPAEWSVREVGDGNINFVYIVEGPGGALVVKQALPYVRVVGESWPMTLDRIYYEALALRQQFAWVPELVPEVYFFSHPMALLVMRYVAPPAIVLRKGLVQGRVYPRLAEHMSSFLASTLFLSSLIAINTEVYRDKVREFCGNVEMCRLTEQVIFTEPYVLATNNRWTTPQLDADAAALREDVPLKLAITELKSNEDVPRKLAISELKGKWCIDAPGACGVFHNPPPCIPTILWFIFSGGSGGSGGSSGSGGSGSSFISTCHCGPPSCILFHACFACALVHPLPAPPTCRFCERAQALLHADLHTGSVMVTEESTVVIDPEFAFYGPMGFDIGAFLGNLLLAYFSQDGHATADDSRAVSVLCGPSCLYECAKWTDLAISRSPSPTFTILPPSLSPSLAQAAKKWLLQCVTETWQKFEAKFLALWNDKALAKGDAYPQALYHDNAALLSAAQTAFLREVFLDSLGFAGAKMIRRIVGIAHVEDLESIADPDVRAACERRALNFGKHLVKERHQFKSIADVAAAVEAIV